MRLPKIKINDEIPDLVLISKLNSHANFSTVKHVAIYDKTSCSV